jgi:hypothetical protein
LAGNSCRDGRDQRCAGSPLNSLKSKLRFGQWFNPEKRMSAQAGCGPRAGLRLAFCASIGFKPGGFMTTGNEREASSVAGRVLDRATHPA